MKFATKPL